MSLARIRYEGHTLNQRTIDMLQAAEKVLGRHLTVIQGSYNKGVSASAGTHDGGGAMDVSPHPGPVAIVTALRTVGFAAWHRLPTQGPWPEHIHAIAMGDRELAPLAAVQVTAYKQGYNGLGRGGMGGRDDGPHVGFDTWEQYRAKTGDHTQPHGKPPTLSMSARNDPAWVRLLQYLLNQANQDDHIHITGIYDPPTRDRVRQYKRRHKFLPVNARAGHRIWDALGIKETK